MPRLPGGRLCLSIALVLGAACPLAAQVPAGRDWRQWRGPASDGHAVGSGIPSAWSSSSNLLWRTPLPGKGGATPCVADGRIFLTSNDLSIGGGDGLVVMCVNAADGRVLWKRPVATGNQDARAGEGNSASPSPTTDGKFVWSLFGTGILACHTVGGEERWRIDLGERFGPIDIQFGLTSTPVLDGDGLYLQLIHGPMRMDDPTRVGKVIRLDARSGGTVWAVERVTDAAFECKHSYASPLLYRHDGREFLVVHGADCTTGHALADGRELWRFGGLNGPTATNPKPHDATFRFVASPGLAPGLIVLPTAKGGPTVALEVSDRLAGDCTGRREVVRWVNPRTPDVACPLVADGLVYLLHNDGQLQCVDAASGENVYVSRTHTGQHRSSPVLVDGKLYFGSNDGWVSVVRAGREFELVGSVDVGEAVSASAVVADGVLYLRSAEALYAIQSGATPGE